MKQLIKMKTKKQLQEELRQIKERETKVEPNYSKNGNDVKPLVKCPECLQPTLQDELDMFGGLCEECSGAFDE